MIDTVVGKRGRSEFPTQAAEKELMRLRQIKALQSAAIPNSGGSGTSSRRARLKGLARMATRNQSFAQIRDRVYARAKMFVSMVAGEPLGRPITNLITNRPQVTNPPHRG